MKSSLEEILVPLLKSVGARKVEFLENLERRGTHVTVHYDGSVEVVFISDRFIAEHGNDGIAHLFDHQHKSVVTT